MTTEQGVITKSQINLMKTRLTWWNKEILKTNKVQLITIKLNIWLEHKPDKPDVKQETQEDKPDDKQSGRDDKQVKLDDKQDTSDDKPEHITG